MIALQKRISISLLLALFLAVFFSLFIKPDPDSALLRGDFPAFYSMGKILANGQGDQLYDIQLQQKVQVEAWPQTQGKVLVAAYPPAMAALMLPFAYLPAFWAKQAFCLLSIAALAFSVFIFRATLKEISPWLLFTLLLTFPPLFISVFGGQLTPFVIFIFSCFYSLRKRGLAFFSGLVVSLIFLKPQFSPIIALYLFASGPWKASIGFLIGGVFQYLLAVCLLGWNWPMLWLPMLDFFSRQNLSLNLFQQTSFSAFIAYFASIRESAANYFTLFSYPIFALIWIWLLVRLSTTPKGEYSPAKPSFWELIALISLLTPQASFYDLGISFFALLIAYFEKSQFRLNFLFVLNHLVLVGLVIFREQIKANTFFPFFALIALIYAYLSWRLWTKMEGGIHSAKDKDPSLSE